MKDVSSPSVNLRFAICAGSVLIAAAPSLMVEFPGGDLHRHVYDAWLGHLVLRGQAPGLWLAPALSNSLVSRALEVLLGCATPRTVERLTLFILAQGFLWASFAYCRALSERPCWEWLLALSMLSIGWTFQTGLVNWFASAAMSLAAGALLLRRGESRRRRYWAVPMFVVAATGNPMPPLWICASTALVVLHRRAPRSGKYLLAALSFGVLSAGPITVLVGRGAYTWHQLYGVLAGADQLWIYDSWYGLASGGLLVVWGAAAIRLYRAPDAEMSSATLVAIFSTVCVLGVPDAVIFPGYEVPAFYLARRGSLLAGVAVTATMAQAHYSPRRTLLLASTAVLWVAFLAADWSHLSHLQADMNRAVAEVPAGGHVVSSMGDGLFDPALHRSCTGRCFVWSDYQPSSGAFRVRAAERNSFVIARFEDYLALETGSYRLPVLPFPVWEVAHCESPAPPENICVRLLRAGDVVRKECVRHVSGWPGRRVTSRCAPVKRR